MHLSGVKPALIIFLQITMCCLRLLFMLFSCFATVRCYPSIMLIRFLVQNIIRMFMTVCLYVGVSVI